MQPINSPAAIPIDASMPTERSDEHFQERHATFLKRIQAGRIGLLFLGDSITRRWVDFLPLWEHYFARYQPANFGVGSDCTQNLIWRIEHGELDGIDPEVIVLLIGTNNTATNSGAEIAAAIRKIIGIIQAKLPRTKMILMAIFPRGPQFDPNGSQPPVDRSPDDTVRNMDVVRAANAELATLDNGTTIRFLDIGARLIGPNGKIPTTVMADQIHLIEGGYRIWAEALQPLLVEMLGEQQ